MQKSRASTLIASMLAMAGAMFAPPPIVPGLPLDSAKRRRSQIDSNGITIGKPGSKLARKAAKGAIGLYSGRRGFMGGAR